VVCFQDVTPRATSLFQIWANLRSDRDKLLLPISLQEFRDFIHTQFGASAKGDMGVDSLIDMVYQEFDATSKANSDTNKGRVMLRDILNGFAQVLATTASDQASFFFDYCRWQSGRRLRFVAVAPLTWLCASPDGMNPCEWR